MDLTKLSDESKKSLLDFYLGLCFNSIKKTEEKIEFILNNKDMFNKDTYDNILENIIIVKDMIRQKSSGFYKVQLVIMSEKRFEELKKQQQIDENINSISVRGSKVFSSNNIIDNKIIFISEPKTKIDSKLTDIVTIMEN